MGILISDLSRASWAFSESQSILYQYMVFQSFLQVKTFPLIEDQSSSAITSVVTLRCSQYWRVQMCLFFGFLKQWYSWMIQKDFLWYTFLQWSHLNMSCVDSVGILYEVKFRKPFVNKNCCFNISLAIFYDFIIFSFVMVLLHLRTINAIFRSRDW